MLRLFTSLETEGGIQLYLRGAVCQTDRCLVTAKVKDGLY